ncbi:MAG: caspase family protein [Reyranella sp.]|uniref:caspase family protein n=1 Tax=Reyranella sp. TaxID=1929291 RepID=UPI002731B9CD|nr:caspase family protein [Reyranella sp.]MDP1966258.1 caspase family protein [Reyranella sp.]MDP2373914.1 caspase family protein [Reyranella sp.]
MSEFLIYEKNVQGPATHALVIGVGHYPHLGGGGGRKSPYSDGMIQLTSPPISALAFANWLIGTYNNPAAQLATVALLATQPVPPAPFPNARIPSLQNVILAAEEWWQRGRTSEEDVLIFYFSGHGVSEGLAMSLLLSDFGQSDAAPYSRAIDFNKFCLGMARAKARRQLFFVDACRSSSDTFAGSGGAYGNPLIEPNADEYSAKEAPVFFSTLAGDSSYGRTHKTTVFTEALLEGLNGGGGSDQDGPWEIWTSRLNDSLRFTMEQQPGDRRQVPNMGNGASFAFHRLPGPPKVPTIIGCSPDMAADHATLAYKSDDTGEADERAPPHANAWKENLTAGIYDFYAAFPGNQYRNALKRNKSVVPPYQRIRIEVVP